jgi:hypothetical protein
MRNAHTLVAARVGRAAPDLLTLSPARQSYHAQCRAAQRNLPSVAVAYIMAWGRLIHRTGVDFYFLGNDDIPAQHRHLPWVARLAGAVALVARDGEVITLYRHANAPRDIQRKMKYRITPGWDAIVADVAYEGE